MIAVVRVHNYAARLALSAALKDNTPTMPCGGGSIRLAVITGLDPAIQGPRGGGMDARITSGHDVGWGRH